MKWGKKGNISYFMVKNYFNILWIAQKLGWLNWSLIQSLFSYFYEKTTYNHTGPIYIGFGPKTAFSSLNFVKIKIKNLAARNFFQKFLKRKNKNLAKIFWGLNYFREKYFWPKIVVENWKDRYDYKNLTNIIFSLKVPVRPTKNK